MSERFNINVKIAGKSYSIPGIERSKEERYRRAEKELNAMIQAFKGSYRASDEESYLAMAALQLALNNVELELRGSLDSEEEKLRAIDKELDSYLREIK